MNDKTYESKVSLLENLEEVILTDVMKNDLGRPMYSKEEFKKKTYCSVHKSHTHERQQCKNTDTHKKDKLNAIAEPKREPRNLEIEGECAKS